MATVAHPSLWRTFWLLPFCQVTMYKGAACKAPSPTWHPLGVPMGVRPSKLLAKRSLRPNLVIKQIPSDSLGQNAKSL